MRCSEGWVLCAKTSYLPRCPIPPDDTAAEANLEDGAGADNGFWANRLFLRRRSATSEAWICRGHAHG
ncbi:hypothetical protein RV134_320093 [Roseovarius sp. EC-HK134]|nr:hypothetical protein RV134_320093 [Roseovarius sp. EC-HK134]